MQNGADPMAKFHRFHRSFTSWLTIDLLWPSCVGGLGVNMYLFTLVVPILSG
ncbi:hypothetical protein BV22DRAFT_1034110 [Leucogyrophana mollusca]|uniref:Uncharacterized protein n=1 Tax=Leucogyrophana mollusca TaxID=85980 RepID=A0ACB8BHM9_9AGAM|nr:hypothetical protein BV22DRAFT_1034110 [Leucogyrophana mollusca]